MRGDGLSAVIDMVALLFVVAMGIGHALGAKAADNKITRFGDGCVRGCCSVPYPSLRLYFKIALYAVRLTPIIASTNPLKSSHHQSSIIRRPFMRHAFAGRLKLSIPPEPL